MLVGALFLVVHMVLGNILEPRMMGHRLGMSTMVVFLSLLIWGWLLGPVGMLLSVPLTSVCKIWMETTKGGSKLAILLGRVGQKPFAGITGWKGSKVTFIRQRDDNIVRCAQQIALAKKKSQKQVYRGRA